VDMIPLSEFFWSERETSALRQRCARFFAQDATTTQSIDAASILLPLYWNQTSGPYATSNPRFHEFETNHGTSVGIHRFPNVKKTLTTLRNFGVNVLFGIDATNLLNYKILWLSTGSFCFCYVYDSLGLVGNS